MNCIEFRRRIDDFIDGALDEGTGQAAGKHAGHCPECHRLVEEEQALRQALRNLPVEPAGHGFAARALNQARKAHAQPKRSAFAAGFSSAAAIILVVWGVSAQWLGPARSDAPVQVQLALAEQRPVSLVFEVPAEIPDAELAMELPAHVELAGYPHTRSLSWRTDLAKGRNVLTLPIVGRQSAEGELVAKITYGGKERRFRVQVNVDAPQVWREVTGRGRPA